MGGQSDVDGEISSPQRGCTSVSGIPLHYLPLVLGGEIKRGEIADWQPAHLGYFGGRDGGRSLVGMALLETSVSGVLEKIG
jgi:hypothetical protein